MGSALIQFIMLFEFTVITESEKQVCIESNTNDSQDEEYNWEEEYFSTHHCRCA